MKAIVWPDNVTEIGQFEFVDIPDDLLETVNEWREKLMEACAEHDEELMERYFEDPESITIEEMKAVVRKATIAGTIIPMFFVVLLLRTKVFNACSMPFVPTCRARSIKENLWVATSTMMKSGHYTQSRCR
jgi:translation elongation factor EF-G